jgi:replication factor A1
LVDIKDLHDGAKRVDVQAQVVEKSDPREVRSRYKDETYRIVDAVVADETGSIKLTLWNEQADMVNVGKFGKLTVE